MEDDIVNLQWLVKWLIYAPMDLATVDSDNGFGACLNGT